MSRRQLLLHVGMHKTASTSIQGFLYANREQLHERGVLYPDGPCIAPGHQAQHVLAWTIRRRPGYTDTGRWRDALELIRSDPSPHVVLSSEDFEKFTRDEIVELADYVGDFDVRVVQVIRDAWGFLTSNYKHNIVFTGMTEDFRTFMEREARRCDFAARTDAWAEAFGAENVAMPILDKLVSNGGVIRHFAGLIAPGLWSDVATNDTEPRLNLSVDDSVVRGLRVVNRLAARAHLDVTNGGTAGRVKRRLAKRGRAGRAVSAADRIVPGTFWREADRDWLRPRVRAWNDSYFPRYAPAADRRYLDV